jgi:peroxiredoxin Q/BCP
MARFRLGLAKPERFAAVASLSGALDMPRRARDAGRQGSRVSLEEWIGILGPESQRSMAPIPISISSPGSWPPPRPKAGIYLACGTEDELLEDSRAFRRHLEALRLPATYVEGPGSHEWGYWDAQIQKVLDWLPLRKTDAEDVFTPQRFALVWIHPTMKLRILLSSVVALASLTLFAKAEPLAVGAPAPDVSAIDQDGKPVNFKDVYAKGPTLVYFYPKADTPGCTKEGCSIRDSWEDLKKAGIQVLGVSEDPADAQKAFAEKYKFPHTLIADADGKVAAAFQVT